MTITLENLDDVYRAKQASVDTMQAKGYKLLKEFFVDSSGFGAEDELALTVDQFNRELKQFITKHGKATAKITGAGQFQVYVGLFSKGAA